MILSDLMQNIADCLNAPNHNKADIFQHCADASSTSGYDNDGSVGPELVDTGIALGLKLADYRIGHPKSDVFVIDYFDTTFYVIGEDERYAVARFRNNINKRIKELDADA
jgi:hypothetical protein